MTVARNAIQADDALDSARALALDALRLARLLPDSSRWPARWTHPAFAADVEGTRRRLARIRTRRTLVASYQREIFDHPVRRADRGPGSAIRVAYALRWLELRDGVTGPSWPAMIG